nr:zinc finger, CCHC-type [Tanacetum cinerariifolium]
GTNALSWKPCNGGSVDDVTTSLQLSQNSRPPMLDHQDKYMMKAQVHMSKSSEIFGVQALPLRKHFFKWKFNREDFSSMSIPMDPIEKLKPNTRKPVDQLEYSRAIGCLMYAMTSTRPNIAYAVGRLSRFTSNPSRQHWKAITRVFKYLRGTKDYGLSYVRYPLVLEGYSNASWVNHVEDSSSTSGWVFLLRGGAIS